MTPAEQQAAAIVEEHQDEDEREKFWDFWVGNDPLGGIASAVLFVRHLAHWRGRRVDLHKIVQADQPNCFHTHPAWAIRIILRGGYYEEAVDRVTGEPYHQVWRPGNVGLVAPQFTHRISRLINGPSYSLWLRGQCNHNIWVGGFREGQKYFEEELSHVKEDV